jgi:serine/threonine-protein kinase
MRKSLIRSPLPVTIRSRHGISYNRNLAVALTAGTRVGPYEITAQIGVGGMGEVWCATDTNLGRQVAIKILPDAFAQDPDRLARFEREAKVLASLNHPNIAHIYGLEKADGIRALVMELVEGPTLAERIAQGPIALDDALPIARQIADALEAAHEQGIIHRDLKPANIKLRPDGVAKVLDFGLAKALAPMSGGGEVTASPTIMSPTVITGVAVLLGTAAYMSPEQAKGRTVDKRSDIWAFGAVLFEMLTARRAFDAEDVSETLAKVLMRAPDWAALPPTTPRAVTKVLQGCLQKDRKKRIRDIGDVALALEDAADTTVTQRADATVPPVRMTWRWHLVPGFASLVTGIVVALAMWFLRPSTEPPFVGRFDYVLPEGQLFRNTGRPMIDLSPDGSRFVYNAAGGLYLRTMGELRARLIAGTEEALTSPTFSPDGQSIAYFQEGQLKRIAISGGAPVVICAASNPFGVSWSSDNTILFGQPDGIMRVSANGGTPELVIRAEKGEQVDGPRMLPDGESVLFSVTRATGTTRWDQADIVVQSLRSSRRTVVLKGGSDARYVPTGHLVYALGDGLFAVPFDTSRLVVDGGPVSVIEGVRRAAVASANTGTAHYGVSTQGNLVHATGDSGMDRQRTLVWVDRTGREEVISAPARAYMMPRLSPDGTRVALFINDQEQDIWIWDLARQALTRLTFDAGPDVSPVWSPDSQRVIFASARSGSSNLYWQAADGTGSVERLTESRNIQVPYAVTPDGTEILLRELISNQNDLMRLPLASQRPPSPSVSKTPAPLVRTMFNEQNAELAPKGQWLAYESNESGRYEIYVRPFPNVEAGRWQISTNGGTTPLWSRSGEELFYIAADRSIQGVRVDSSSSWRSSTPMKVLRGPYFFLPGNPTPVRAFDIAPDGKRFLMMKESSTDDASERQSLIIVEHWLEELKRLVPAK